MEQVLYTIGHSAHSQEHFISLLKMHDISAVCDVRSQPYSRRSPHFNREALKVALENHHIAYVFLGDALGARSTDSSCYENGRVSYNRLANTPLFQKGMERLREEIRRFRVALLCAEKDPLACHRTILVCRHVKAPDLSIRHILDDGSLETHDAAERRLLLITGAHQGNLFAESWQLLERAYDLQGQEIAYRILSAPPDSDEAAAESS